ncbi:MAG TPA: non-canonical purine NTP pyrophosphatase [Chloroflexota bacterium]|nr:non-canonical purine NTP pyrophosphatase [Chloroflexota bacterium]
MRVLLATTNQHKAKEFQRLFAGNDLDVRTPTEWGLAPLTVEETGLTFAANALTKAHAYASAYRMPALADDSGICVDALAGAPGVRSARFGRPNLDDEGRARYVLDCLKGIPDHDRGAHYVCALALVVPEEEPIVVEGKWYGRVADQYLEGGTGFGYDPVFRIPSLDAPVSRLTPEQKDALGHRGKAARRLIAAIAARRFNGLSQRARVL